ncbi:MAG: glycosyltransferase [Microgenomates group bacterium]
MNSKISIVTVTYNSSKNIVNLLNSMYRNRAMINEVFIIENNSNDRKETKRICEKFSKKMKLSYICRKNVGFGTSCNYGANLSKSELILFLNPDTEIEGDSLKILLDHFQKDKADIIGGKAINYEGKIHGSVVRYPTLFTGLFEFSNLGKFLRIKSAHEQFYYEDLNILRSKLDRQVDAVSGAYLLIAKNTFSKLKGFDENIFMYLEDVDLCKRANDLGLRVFFCPHSIIRHVGGASSQNKYKIRHQAWFDSRKYYYRKHFGILANIIIQPIYTIEEFLLKMIKKI